MPKTSLQCPCGLNQAQLEKFRSVDSQAICTALGEDNQPCGKRFIDHPTGTTVARDEDGEGSIIRRRYFLTDLKSSPELLPHGLRTHILQLFQARQVCGTIRRAYSEEWEQHIIAMFYGKEETLNSIESTILEPTTYWKYQRDLTRLDEAVQCFPFHDIRVLDSLGNVKPNEQSKEWADKDARAQINSRSHKSDETRSQKSDGSSLISAGGGVRAANALRNRPKVETPQSISHKIWLLLSNPKNVKQDADPSTLSALLDRLGYDSAERVKYIKNNEMEDITRLLKSGAASEFAELMGKVQVKTV